MTAGVVELTRTLRELQLEFDLLTISATVPTNVGMVTMRLTGVQSPIGVLEDEDGNTVAIRVP